MVLKAYGSKDQIIAEYILLIEKLIGKQITHYGIGSSCEDYIKRNDAFNNFL